MEAINFARRGFSREKPRSSITDWVEIMTGPNFAEEAYDGVPELVESINLQPTGPAEASRALRKKLKHGDVRQKYRAIVILHALVGNCGENFQRTFADDQLTDTLKFMASDPATSPRIRRRLLSVLLAWQKQFKDDPKMSIVAGLYRLSKPLSSKEREVEFNEKLRHSGLGGTFDKKEKTTKKKKKEDGSKEKKKKKRGNFDFEKEKPEVMSSIVNATQATNNLVNAITLVNTQIDSIQTNARVQECVEKVKQVRKRIVMYVQLVEDEEIIGTLIETNERMVSALAMYNQYVNPDTSKSPSARESEVTKFQDQQRAAVERTGQDEYEDDDDIWDGRKEDANELSNAGLHPDLQDLSFGPLGKEAGNLPPPIRPTSAGRVDDGPDLWQTRGSLSDYSDYESSNEETHTRRALAEGSSTGRTRKEFVTVSDDGDDDVDPSQPVLSAPEEPLEDEDPFADPFADERVAIAGVAR